MIYLDNAATSYPKPLRVIGEMTRQIRRYGGNPGRGSHQLSLAASERIYECREQIASLFSSAHPERVCFTLNATSALNLVIKGGLNKGDHVLISDMEHNAVYRPIYKLAKEGKITYDVFPSFVCNPTHRTAHICTSIAKMIKPNTKMLICAHASNICSAALPLEEIGRICKRKGILFVVDAAQSAGRLPIDVQKMQIDALCVPGHKGLWGPQGCGFALLENKRLSLDTLTEGGSGYHSLDAEMPLELPERHEAGTPPTPAIAGLCAGIKELSRIGVEAVCQHEMQLYDRLYERMAEHNKITVFAPYHRGGILLFDAHGVSSEQLAMLLDKRSICVRAGFHCAALAHKTLQTPETGAVRVSMSFWNTASEIDQFYSTLCECIE